MAGPSRSCCLLPRSLILLGCLLQESTSSDLTQAKTETCKVREYVASSARGAHSIQQIALGIFVRRARCFLPHLQA